MKSLTKVEGGIQGCAYGKRIQRRKLKEGGKKGGTGAWDWSCTSRGQKKKNSLRVREVQGIKRSD